MDDSVMAPPQTLDRRLNAFRQDLADSRLKGKIAASAYTDGKPAQVGMSAIPLLRRADPLSPMDSQLLPGERVTVFDEGDGWSWVQAETDGYVGYVASEGLSSTLIDPTHWVSARQTIVLADAEQICAPLGCLSLGSRVCVAEEGERFHRIASGGWIYTGHLRPIGEFETDPVAVADQLLGLPYLWGGLGFGGIDCSGLVQLSFAVCGFACLRDSDQQATSIGTAQPLEPRDWQRGDLIYVPGHVLIVRNETEVIHATGYQWSVIVEDTETVLQRLHGQDRPIETVRRP